MVEMRVWSLGQEDTLEKEMTIHSSILAWENFMDKGVWWGWLSRDHKELDMTERARARTHTHTHTHKEAWYNGGHKSGDAIHNTTLLQK